MQEIAIKWIEQIHMFSCELLMQRETSDDEDDGIGGSLLQNVGACNSLVHVH